MNNFLKIVPTPAESVTEKQPIVDTSSTLTITSSSTLTEITERM